MFPTNRTVFQPFCRIYLVTPDIEKNWALSFIKEIFLFLIMYMCACLWVGMCRWVRVTKDAGAVVFPVAGVTGCYEPLDVGSRNRTKIL